MPQIVWAAGPDGRIDYYNDRWYEYTGLAREDSDQPGWQEILHPDDVERCLRTYHGSIHDERPFVIECRFKDRQSNGHRWFMGRALPVRDEADQLVRWFGTWTDIDEQKRAQEDLQAADQRKDEFLAILAHELRNPLAPIRNSLHILRLTPPSVPPNERVLQIMERQLTHMVRLVDDLLELSRISRGKIELKKEWLCVADIMECALEASRPIIDAAGHTLSISQFDESLAIEGDFVRLSQVFANILNNAAKYSEKGGNITVDVERDNAAVAISIRDTGIGIPRDMLPRVFEMFTQLDHSRNRSGGGLGIGLNLVRTLVELHGGTVEAHSGGLGQGSQFVVKLPLAVSLSRENNAIA